MATKNEKREAAQSSLNGNASVKEGTLPVQHPAPDKPKAKGQEAVYTVEELAAGAETLYGTRPECVTAALREKGITACAKEEAGEIVGRFIRKEVK
ncbi:MAG: hypothetical protein HFH69_12435 [Lachnospiraceae bacterium]|nr:hypothetical protein [Lachnospiraceae bacterium]